MTERVTPTVKGNYIELCSITQFLTVEITKHFTEMKRRIDILEQRMEDLDERIGKLPNKKRKLFNLEIDSDSSDSEKLDGCRDEDSDDDCLP